MGSSVKPVNGGIFLMIVKTLFSPLLFFSSMNVLEPIDRTAIIPNKSGEDRKPYGHCQKR